MRKLIIEIKPNALMREFRKGLFEDVEYYEMVQFLKLDIDNLYRVGLLNLHLKDGADPDDLRLPPSFEIMSVFQKDENLVVCIAKIHSSLYAKAEMKKFDLDVVWDVPLIFAEDRRVYSLIGEEEELQRFVKAIQSHGEITDVKYQRVTTGPQTMVSVLSEKQREIILEAKRRGYYDTPRRISGDELAKTLGLSTSTTIEHLRKAERRIIELVLEGYDV